MTTTVKLDSSGLVKVTSGGTPTTIIDVTKTYKTVSDIDTVSSNMSSALSTATDAKSTANAASTTANAASTTASDALTTANAASTTASDAKSTASDALTTANAASTTASDALTTASDALTTANAASTTASDALTTANAANTSASNDTNLVRYLAVSGNTTLGEFPSSTMIIILSNFGSDMQLTGSTTAKLVKGSDTDNQIHIEDWSTVFFVRTSSDTFRFMLSVHADKAPQYR